MDHYTDNERLFWEAVDRGEVKLKEAPNVFNHDLLDPVYYRASQFYCVRFEGRPYQQITDVSSALAVLNDAKRWY